MTLHQERAAAVRQLVDQTRTIEKSGATFVDWELSYKLGYQRPSEVRIVIARAKYWRLRLIATASTCTAGSW